LKSLLIIIISNLKGTNGGDHPPFIFDALSTLQPLILLLMLKECNEG
jgi:hypothetical protein